MMADRLDEIRESWAHDGRASAGMLLDVEWLIAEVVRLRADYERMWSALQAETATGVRVRGELRAALSRVLESFTEPEDDNDIIRQAREALGTLSGG